MTLEELQIVLELNNQQLMSGLAQTQAQLGKLNTTVSNSTSGIKSAFGGIKRFIIGLGIGKALASSIKEGMDSIETDNRFQVLFGGMSKEVRQWSEDLQTSLGLSAYSTRENVATFYELSKGMGVASNTAKDMAENMTQMAYDVASFKNIDPSKAFDAMQAALVGNTKSLRSLGYVVTSDMVKQEAYKQGIAATGSELTRTQKAMATYSVMCSQMRDANGDLARTIQSPANQLRILKDNLKNLKIEIGRAFTPIAQVVLPLLNKLVTKIIQVVKVIGLFMQALFGKSISGNIGGGSSNPVQEQADSAEDLAQGYQDATEEAKEYKNTVMGFDELNKLDSQDKNTSDSNSDDTGIGDTDIGDLGWEDTESEAEEIPAKIQAIADKVKNILNKFKDFFEKHKNVIIAIIGGIIAGFAAFETLNFLAGLPEMIAAIAPALSVIVSPIGLAAIAIGGLVAILIYCLETNEDFRNQMADIWKSIGKLFTDFADNTLKPFNDFVLNEFLKPIGDAFGQYMIPVFEGFFVSFSKILYSVIDLVLSVLSDLLDAIKPFLEVIKNVIIDVFKIINDWWNKYGESITDAICTAIGTIKDILHELYEVVLKPIIDYLCDALQDLWDNYLKDMFTQLMDFVGKVMEDLLKLWNEVLAPLIEWIIETIGPTVVEVVKVVIDVLKDVFGFISDMFKDLFKILGGIIDFITGIFTGDWELAWQGIQEIFGGVWDAICDIAKAVVTIITDIIKGLVNVVVALCKGLWELLKGIFEVGKNAVVAIVQGLSDGIKAIFNGIKDICGTLGNWLKGAFDKITQVISDLGKKIGSIAKDLWNGLKDIFKSGVDTVGNVVTTLGSKIKDIFGGIKNTLGNIGSWIGSTFKNLWSNAWKGIVNVFTNIWNGITKVVKAPLNFIIDTINKVIGGLNKIKLPSWVPGIGGKGINIPLIPRLAKGGIVDKPTTALVGESGPEMIVPLKNTDFVTKLANAVGNAVYANMLTILEDNTSDDQPQQQIVLKVDSTELGRAAINSINKVTKMEGQLRIRTI